MGFPDGSVVKNAPAMQETRVWSLGQEDPPGEGKGNQLQYSCLGNPMDRGAWEVTVYGVTKNWTRLKTKQQQVNVGSHFMFARRWKWCTWPKNKTDFVWQTQKDHILTKWEAQCSSADRAPRGPSSFWDAIWFASEVSHGKEPKVYILNIFFFL